MERKPQNKSIRMNFILLLLLSITAILVSFWLFFVSIAMVAGESIFQSMDSLWFDLFMAFLFPLIVGILISSFSIILSVILRQKWWIAVPGTIILLGTPLIAFAITWIGSQIARLFYLATPKDLQLTKRLLKMTIKPRKGYLPGDGENGAETISQKSYLFSLWQSTIAAIFGGFFGGGLVLSLNFKKMGGKNYFGLALIISLLLQFALVVVITGVSRMYPHPDFVILIPFMLAIPISIYLLHYELQNEEIELAISTGQVEKESWWSVLGLILISFLFNVLCIFPAYEILMNLNSPILY
jgi:hypothetical protein